MVSNTILNRRKVKPILKAGTVARDLEILIIFEKTLKTKPICAKYNKFNQIRI
jgi:hypothetical protein